MSVMQVGKWARGVALPPDWWVPKADGRTLDLDFLAGAYWDSIAGAQRIGAAASFDRNSAGGRFGPTGAYEVAAAAVLRRDYDPATLAGRGAAIEPAVAYAGVNSLLTGAVAGVVGSGGAKPDGMVVGRPSGLTEEVFLGTTAGIPWMELRISGTASSTGAITIFLNASTGTAAVAGQTWRHALYVAVTNDDAAVNVLAQQVSERNSGGSFVATTGAASIYSVRSTWDRRSISALLTGGTTANIMQQLATNSITSGTTIDWRIRIGGATFTQTAYLPSVYLVGTSAATRLADTLSLPFGSWGVQGAGTILVDAEFIAGGAAVNNNVVQIDAGSGANRVMIRRHTDNNIAIYSLVGGVQQCVLGPGLVAAGRKRIAFAYGTNDFRAIMTGGSIVSDTAGTVPTGLTHLRLGSNSAGTESLNGWLGRVAYLPFAADNTALSAWVAA